MAKAKKSDVKGGKSDTDINVFNMVCYPRPKAQLAMVVLDGREQTSMEVDGKTVDFRANVTLPFDIDMLTKVPAQTKRLMVGLREHIESGKITLTIGDRYGCQVLFRDPNNCSIVFSQDLLGIQDNQYFRFVKAKAECGFDFLRVNKTWAGATHNAWSNDDLDRLIAAIELGMD